MRYTKGMLRWSRLMRDNPCGTALLLLVCCLLPSALHAQAVLPSAPQSVGYVNGRLHVYSAGVLLAAQYKDDDIVTFTPDTFFVKIDDDITYVVQQPETGDYYYTAPDRKGRSCLYVAHREPHRSKTRRVKMGDMEVEHPVFNADGTIMVFASMERNHGYGGYDLWYSRYRDGEWQEPHNMGNRVNTTGDEVSPWVAGGYLFFSSNGREDSRQQPTVYATRLIARQVIGDTVGMLQIGRSRVQQLPECAEGGACYGFVVDSARGGAYWYDAAAGIRYRKGALEAMTLWGYAYGVDKKPLEGVKVTAREGEKAVSETVTRKDGFYRITLPAGRTYAMEYRLKNRYVHRAAVSAKADEVNLIGERQLDVTLDGLPVGRPLYYTDLFGPDAVVDLSAHGREQLDVLVRFLKDNPTLRVQLTLTCDVTDNAEYNALLTGHRLRVLEDYLRERLPAGMALETRCGVGEAAATGETKLSVMLK